MESNIQQRERLVRDEIVIAMYHLASYLRHPFASTSHLEMALTAVERALKAHKGEAT